MNLSLKKFINFAGNYRESAYNQFFAENLFADMSKICENSFFTAASNNKTSLEKYLGSWQLFMMEHFAKIRNTST